MPEYGLQSNDYQEERSPLDRSIPRASAAAAELMGSSTSEDDEKTFSVVVASKSRYYTAQNNIAYISKELSKCRDSRRWRMEIKNVPSPTSPFWGMSMLFRGRILISHLTQSI